MKKKPCTAATRMLNSPPMREVRLEKHCHIAIRIPDNTEME
eukprot:CAMPEP_0173393252 /NCGR_PEP_ID=MMETSP1356-20130122/22008_1 /TAXON_ID=77927 ORGANISM="Hemiselmis virescens, Strain PCC157" /NCGR_SAMPLE_ID=MMETSP1356 /ASSEMBLY_ACC=CAM_ASM_000847 /LENGTH=40 /DNA_ID= /DNA_START= /DNA_END= /DNA_ORIENTATION=